MTTTHESMSGYCIAFDPTVGVGSLGSQVPLTFVRANTWMNIDNNIRSKQDCNSFPIFNAAAHTSQTGPIHENYYVNETGRGEVNPQNKSQLNLKGQEVWNNLSFLDHQKTTTKETTEYAYAGNAQRQGDGTEFWTYTDAPKTTTKETTEYAYAGNAQRQGDGTEFWTYTDAPKTTTKETTEYAYAGNAQRQGLAESNRSQYTGYNEDGVKSGGADTYAIRGSTLVTNYMPNPGRQNLLADAEARQGKIDYGTFGSDENYNGPGTINQALPDGSKYQYQYILGEQRISPNKLVAIDDRQLAGYQVEQLQSNPLSIYTINPENPIPGFECYIQPEDFSTISTTETNTKLSEGYQGINETVSVYPNYSNKETNPNADIVYNKNINQNNNSFIEQAGIPNSIPTFMGKCYSGDPDFKWNTYGQTMNNKKITLGGVDEPDVAYGNMYSPIKYMLPGMAQGENCPGQPLREGNRALNFATSPQFITNNF